MNSDFQKERRFLKAGYSRRYMSQFMRTILLTLTLLAASGCLSKVHLDIQAQKGPSLAEKGVTHIAGELLDTFTYEELKVKY